MSDSSAERFTYRAVVLGNTLQTSKEKGTPSVKIKLKCEFDVLRPDIPVTYIVYGDLWLTFKTIKKTLKTLKEVFEWKGKFIEDFNQPILAGKKCDIVVDEGEWDGKPTFDIQFFNKIGGLKSMELTDLQSLINEVQPMINEEMGITQEEHEENTANNAADNAAVEESEILEPEPVKEDDLPF